jgi:uncharacterized paraquat-inducible protein A
MIQCPRCNHLQDMGSPLEPSEAKECEACGYRFDKLRRHPWRTVLSGVVGVLVAILLDMPLPYIGICVGITLILLLRALVITRKGLDRDEKPPYRRWGG